MRRVTCNKSNIIYTLQFVYFTCMSDCLYKAHYFIHTFIHTLSSVAPVIFSNLLIILPYQMLLNDPLNYFGCTIALFTMSCTSWERSEVHATCLLINDLSHFTFHVQTLFLQCVSRDTVDSRVSEDTMSKQSSFLDFVQTVLCWLI